MNAALPSINILAWSSWSVSSIDTRLPPITHHQSPPSLPKMPTMSSDIHFFRPPTPKTSPVISDPAPPSPLPMDTSLPPPQCSPNTSAAAASIITTLALAPAPPSYMVDWLDFTRTRSAHFIAEKTCEMLCYLWFSVPSHARLPLENPVPLESQSDSKLKGVPSVTSLQLIATPAFVSFMQKLLETTQVSQSVIVLSLHYIHRLKEKNAYTPAQPGSEFRIAVTGLMMANKFLDDNTYTNKTWSEVSGISLDEINRMEREFLLGVDFNLYVDKTTYASWLNLLKGLVLAKERDARRLLRGGATRVSSSARRGMRSEREGRFWHPHHPQNGARFGSTGPAHRTYTTAVVHPNDRRQSVHPATQESAHTYRHRARSTSPRSFAFSNRSVAAQEQNYTLNVTSQVRQEPQQEEQSAYSRQFYQPVQSGTSPSMDYARPSSPTPVSNMPLSESITGTKRSAEDAFASPLPSTFIPNQARLRRPASMYGKLHTLQIPEFSSTSSASSSSVASSLGRRTSTSNPSPLDGLGGFERMSLDGEEQRQAEERRAKRARAEPPVATIIPQTLMAAYSADEAKRATLPKNLFFYTLASSPSADEKARERERLRELQSERTSSDAMGTEAEPEPYYEPRARKAKLRCQAAQPVKYGYNYADLNAFPAPRCAPLYSYHEPSRQCSAQTQQTYVSASTSSNMTPTTPVSPTPARHIPHIAAYSHPQSHRQSHATPCQPTAVPFPSAHGQLSHAAVVQSASASPASYTVGASEVAAPGALPHFRDDIWAKPPLPAQAHICMTGPGHVAGTKWFEGGRQKELEQQVIDYSDSPAVQTTSSVAAAAAHSSSPYRHGYASTNPSSSSSSHPGSGASSPYYQQQQQQQQQNIIRRQILQDIVPSAPFANAGPPGVGVQFYATPEVQQVHVRQMPDSVHQRQQGVYNVVSSYQAYSTSSSCSNVNGSYHPYPGPSHAIPPPPSSVPHGHGSTYTYSGAHSTNNSPYHSAASGLYRPGDYGYSAQSSGYGRY